QPATALLWAPTHRLGTTELEENNSVEERMGSKSTSPSRDSDTETTQREERNNTGTASGPSPDLLASLQSLGEHNDHTLLPQSLHQIAEAYSLDEDYQWAVQFLQLEKLYHERLLSNLAALQEDWDQCLSMADTVLKDSHNTRGQCDGRERERSPSHHGKAVPDMAEEEGGEEEGERGKEEMAEEGQGVDEEEVFEESPEEEVQVVEWPAGVPQASAKDLVKLSQVEESSSPDGLVSILKRRRASLDGLPPEGPDAAKQNSKRKVGVDSFLILLLLCLVTVVISLGGTALYCTLVDTYSSICIDFSHNVDFYVVHIQRFLDRLKHWLPIRS
ncbi:unnamed protein product, partial [Coregonus sp. 'balchen']